MNIMQSYNDIMEMPVTALPTSKMSSNLRLISFITFYFLSILLLLANTFIATRSASTPGGNDTDHPALLDFKSRIIQDPEGVLSSWNNSLHFCKWQGVTCGRRHQRVTILDLNSRNFTGFLSPYIVNMSFLRQIILFKNNLQGEIPQEIGRLFRLQVFSVYRNFFSGDISSHNLTHCSKLVTLSIDFNMLVGKIPSELGSLSKLQTLSIDENYLAGVIPSFFGNLTSLQFLSASRNMLEGNIPDALGKLKSLTFLALGENQLSGMIPPSVYNLSLLSIFSLGSNKFYGHLEPNLFLSLPNLQVLQHYQNNFSGPIPISLSNASNIKSIQLSENDFTGSLSINFGGLQQLWEIILYKNNLGEGKAGEMNFLNSLINCSNLETVTLDYNQFQGMLPNFVGNLSTKLQYLGLSENQIYGVLPLGISNLVNLSNLDLGVNRFTGTIPSEIGNMQKFQRLILYSNRFSGKIPFSMGNLSFLTNLQLQDNKLEGAIPSSLGNLHQLLWLDLSKNNLNETIPYQLFDISSLSVELRLAGNNLVGPLPPSVSNLTNLVSLDVSENKLSGDIPSGLGLCLALENLYMEGNFFQGPIPPSLISLEGIQNLDLSRNNLSGNIPNYLEKFPLKTLNLSFNNFEGEVPTKGVFSNASAFSVIGNHNLCGGGVELRLPKCIFNVSKKHKMPHTHLLLIAIASAIVGIIIVSLIICWFMKGRREQSLGSLLKESILKVSYHDLLKGTDGFSSANLIGQGSFGSVYKGNLNETIVAIKVLDLQRRGASKSFTAECEALRNIRHRNLVKVLTSCSSVDFQGNEFKALVYEFMQNGNLDRWLHQTSMTDHEQNELQSLDLFQRVNIAIDVACALDYIHNHCHKPIVHGDLKPGNILLDIDMIAHVADFGLARYLPELTSGSQTSSLEIKGTVGYAAPEYGIGNKSSKYGDVYSYGVLLLEMVTGKRPTDNLFAEGLSLHNFVKMALMALPDRVMEIVDPRLITTIGVSIPSSSGQSPSYSTTSEECLRMLVKIGVACSREAPMDRMKISKVVSELHILRKTLLQNEVSAHET